MRHHSQNSIPATHRHPEASAIGFIGHFLSALLLCTSPSFSTPLSESQVFEWWDNGIIDSDEAREILDLLEEGNDQEACILAEVYALENCTVEDTPKASPKSIPKKNRRPSLAPHGFIEWYGRTDSLGHLERQRTELRLNFYRYSLRLGSQSLLTYKNAGSEAHFGQISTKELHSAIPLDTLWGAAALYPLGMFRAGCFLDTAATSRTYVGIVPNSEFSLGFTYWHHLHPADSTERRSVTLQAQGNWGNFSVWWIPENGREMPLMKMQLQYREKTEHATLGWKADAYAHGNRLPQESHLSSTIAQSRLWGSQTSSATLHDPWKTKMTLNARTMVPLEDDTSKTRIKATVESGPSLLRSALSAACLSAEERCRQNDLTFRAQSTWNLNANSTDAEKYEQIILSGKIRARHTRDSSFSSPLYEAAATYALDKLNKAGIAITVPKGNPPREFRLRSAAEIGTGCLQFSFAITFRRTDEMPLHPLRAAVKAKILF